VTMLGSMFRRLAVCGLAITCATVAIPESVRADAPLTEVNIVIGKIAGASDIYVADKLGYFKDQGLHVNWTYGQSGNEMLSALQSGKIEIALAIPGVAFAAREHGYKLSLVLQNEIARDKGPDSGALIVRNDSGITSVKQLAGKKIAQVAIGNQVWAAVRVVEMKAGLDVTSPQELEMGFPQMPGALQQGLVDAVAEVEPFTSQILAAKAGRVISWYYVESVPAQPIGAYWASDEWLSKNAATGKKFASAVHKAMVYLNAHPAEAKQYVAEFTGMKKEMVDSMMSIRWDSRVDKAVWEKTAQMCVDAGYIKTTLNIDEVVPAAARNPQ
jgi:NitT/TauT family transport system substrate-binding protein